MKNRIYSGLLACIMVFALAACGNGNQAPDQDPADPSSLEVSTPTGDSANILVVYYTATPTT